MPSGTYKHKTRHGKTKTKTYKSWQMMKDRCLNPNNPAYRDYGGRGITICEEWLGRNGFINFFADMGERPKNKNLDRIKNNLGYSKSNCKYSSQKEQCNNRRSNLLITYNNKTQTVAKWSEELGMSYSNLLSRLKLGWSIEKILMTPIKQYNPTKNQEQ